MNIFQIIGVGFVSTILAIILRKQRPEIAFAIPVVATVIIVISVAPHIENVITIFENIAESAGIENNYIKIVIKIIGVAYICQFSAELCKDAGETAIASKIEFGGKIIILSLSAPILYSLLDLVRTIINF